jgi:AhpD family alkylhydroperoxidase
MTTTTTRPIDLRKQTPEAYRALAGVERALATSTLDAGLRELLKLRSSQLNRCAYCLRTHMQAARKAGVAEAKLDVLAAWEEADVYDTRERAALAVCDRVTLLDDGHATDAAIAAAAAQFEPEEVASLVFTVAIMNAWNRLHAAAHTPIP